MASPRGKTPSLFSQSTGKPLAYVSKKRSPCTRCKTDILMSTNCFQIPKASGGFTSPKLFCVSCFSSILDQTKKDLVEFEKALSIAIGGENI